MNKQIAIALTFVMAASTVYASVMDYLGDPPINSYPVYRVLNELCGTSYTSTHEILAERGVDAMYFASNNAEIVSAFIHASYTVHLSYLNEDGDKGGLFTPSKKDTDSNPSWKDVNISLPDMDNFSFVLDLFKEGNVKPDAEPYQTFSSDPWRNIPLDIGLPHFFIIDITDIYKNGEDGKSYYMIGWEEKLLGNNNSDLNTFNDALFIVSGISTTGPGHAPEPATMALIALGGGAAALYRRRLKKQSKE